LGILDWGSLAQRWFQSANCPVFCLNRYKIQKLAGWAKHQKLAQAIALLMYQSGWTGFAPDLTKNTERDSTGKVIKTVEVEQSGKTLWDWLSVLGVPLSLAVLGFWFQQRE
jgi:Holliday junction resolvase